jgi:hypothetical protein
MAKKNKVEIDKESLPTKDEVKMFDILYPMIDGDLAEIRELSKKKQDEPLNKFKVKIINKKLDKAKSILKNESTIEFLDMLDEETLPTNSDAVLQITQFINALNNFRKKFYITKGGIDFGLDVAYQEWETKD